MGRIQKYLSDTPDTGLHVSSHDYQTHLTMCLFMPSERQLLYFLVSTLDIVVEKCLRF